MARRAARHSAAIGVTRRGGRDRVRRCTSWRRCSSPPTRPSRPRGSRRSWGCGSRTEARELVEALRQDASRAQGRALQVVEVGGGFRLVTRPEVAPWLVKLARSKHAIAPVAPRAGDARDHRVPPARVAARGGRERAA